MPVSPNYYFKKFKFSTKKLLIHVEHELRSDLSKLKEENKSHK
jgi:hypothetical protein